MPPGPELVMICQVLILHASTRAHIIHNSQTHTRLESTRAGSCDVERHNASRGADGGTREQPAGFGSMGIV
ncbi:hypothetical protein K456DRAFT_46449 [Colletotrichum gloeosporioides 23]|nr:hypothetical protein K456DRAFT_46449 [Colletotrichum gloeosporioides 23]